MSTRASATPGAAQLTMPGRAWEQVTVQEGFKGSRLGPQAEAAPSLRHQTAERRANLVLVLLSQVHGFGSWPEHGQTRRAPSQCAPWWATKRHTWPLGVIQSWQSGNRRSHPRLFSGRRERLDEPHPLGLMSWRHLKVRQGPSAGRFSTLRERHLQAECAMPCWRPKSQSAE